MLNLLTYSFNGSQSHKTFKQVLKNIFKYYKFNISIYLYFFYKNYISFLFFFFKNINFDNILYLNLNDKTFSTPDFEIFNFYYCNAYNFKVKLMHLKFFKSLKLKSIFFLKNKYHFFFLNTNNKILLRKFSDSKVNNKFITICDSWWNFNKNFLSLPVIVNYSISVNFYYFFIFNVLYSN